MYDGVTSTSATAAYSEGRDRGRQSTKVADHFFDPQHLAPLNIVGVALGATSPDWALMIQGCT